MSAPSWPDLVVEAADECTSILEKGAELDWSRNAAGLEWSCRTTLDHLALGIVGYAGLLIARPADRYITLFASLDAQASIPECLEGVGIAASILASAVREADSDVRAWHPWGHSDGPGFAAMGIVELLVHSDDIARGLGLGWRPPEQLCTHAVRRLFPEAPDGHDAAGTLLWCTGAPIFQAISAETAGSGMEPSAEDSAAGQREESRGDRLFVCCS
ncbi:maleylpyruvate isomerase N-terminal domain-containing protein [Streptomyces sp. 3N207]|uniref:maleylpyruvate isomerase N-terminal domain-containing protein n=1 Tax=Streptomyces sp. 3N207 TaxID=3457417 RepID=UPI003FD2F728